MHAICWRPIQLNQHVRLHFDHVWAVNEVHCDVTCVLRSYFEGTAKMVLFRSKNTWAFEASILECTVFSVNLNVICSFSSRFIFRLFHEDVQRAGVPYARGKIPDEHRCQMYVSCLVLLFFLTLRSSHWCNHVFNFLPFLPFQYCGWDWY